MTSWPNIPKGLRRGMKTPPRPPKQAHRFVPGSRYQAYTSEDRCTRCGRTETAHQ